MIPSVATQCRDAPKRGRRGIIAHRKITISMFQWMVAFSMFRRMISLTTRLVALFRFLWKNRTVSYNLLFDPFFSGGPDSIKCGRQMSSKRCCQKVKIHNDQSNR